MNTGKFLSAALMLAGLMIMSGQAIAQRTVIISVLHGPERPQAQFWKHFADIVEKKLPGEYDFRIVANGALGGERETAEGVLLGSIQGGLSTLGNMSHWLPKAQVFEMPYLFKGREQIKAVTHSEIGQSILDGLVSKGFRALGYINYGERDLVSTRPIKTPEDVRGLKMRVIQSPLHVSLWRFLGASPTPIPVTETYSALQTGVVDMMDFTKLGYYDFHLYEVAPYFTETGHIWSLGVVYFSENFWQSLPEAHREVFRAAAKAVIPIFNHKTQEEQVQALAHAKKEGAKIIKPDREVWKKAVLPFWQAYAKNVGGIDFVNSIANFSAKDGSTDGT